MRFEYCIKVENALKMHVNPISMTCVVPKTSENRLAENAGPDSVQIPLTYMNIVMWSPTPLNRASTESRMSPRRTCPHDERSARGQLHCNGHGLGQRTTDPVHIQSSFPGTGTISTPHARSTAQNKYAKMFTGTRLHQWIEWQYMMMSL